MFQIFTWLADWATAKIGLCAQTPLGSAVHFFIEDVTKIFVLIYVLIFVISLFRAQLSPEKCVIIWPAKTAGTGISWPYFWAL